MFAGNHMVNYTAIQPGGCTFIKADCWDNDRATSADGALRSEYVVQELAAVIDAEQVRQPIHITGYY